MEQMLLSLITGCFGMACGIFFLLYCLEEPIYRPALKTNAFALDSEEVQMRRVLQVLQQLLSFKVPTVMVTLMTCGILGSVFRVVLFGFAPLPILVILSGVAIFITSAIFVPSAIKIFKNASPKASSYEIKAALAPIVRLHRNVGIFVAAILILHLASVAV